jgi:predicted nucleic acid-binding protein
VLDEVVDKFSVHTTEEVFSELQEIAQQQDYLAEAAEKTLNDRDKINLQETESERFQTSRIDCGEASCLALTREIDADFLLTDDLHAMAEIKKISTAEVAISPLMLQAMVENNTITKKEAVDKLEKLAETRDWMGTPIYRRAKNRLEENL